MKAKAEIVQRLLDEKKIDAEEAVALLTASDERPHIIYVDRPYYVYPVQPYQPFWQIPGPYCQSTANGTTFPVNTLTIAN